MPERAGGDVNEEQMKLDRLRRLYALHDPTASDEQVDEWIKESIESNDTYSDSYNDQIERVEEQIAKETGKAHAADVRRIKDNGELFSNIADLTDKLTLDKVGRIRYAMGAVAVDSHGDIRSVGGRFVPRAWLEAIDAHSEQIRDELDYRHESMAQREDRLGQMEEDKPFKIIDKRRVRIEDTPAQHNTGTTEKSEEASEEANESSVEQEVIEHESFILTFIDQTHDALAAARDAAEVRRRNEVQHGGRFQRFLKQIWKGENGIAGAYYLEKYKKEALNQIQDTNDIYTHESYDKSVNTKAQLATIERFQSEYDESIHEEAGERRIELGDDSEFAGSVKELIARYVSGEIEDTEALEEERDRIVAEFNRSDLVGEGKSRIDNIVAIAEQVKAMADHGVSVENALAGMKMYSAESRSNVRSEAHLGKIERTIERLQKTKLGGLVRPETIGAAAAIGLGIARAGRGTLLRAAGVTLVPGVLGGAFAALREGKRVKEERTIHSREMAQGKEYSSGDRRNEMEKARYETVTALSLKELLDEALQPDEEHPLTGQQVQEAYELIASTEARVQLSDKQNIDLVAYSSVTSIEHERRLLDEARALAKTRLSKYIADLPSGFKQRFEINDDHSVNEALQLYTEASVDVASDMSAKDEVFRKLRRRRMVKAGAVGAATSLVIGLGAQESIAALNTNYDGLIEHAIKGDNPSQDGHQTVLEGLVYGEAASTTTTQEVSLADYHSHELSAGGGVINLPEGYGITTQDDGKITITTPVNGESIRDLEIDSNGLFTDESIAILAQHSVAVSETGGFVEHEETSVKTLAVAEYTKLHTDEMTHIKRDFWYDNNTVKFDKNELQLDWGDTSKAADGEIRMQVSGMTDSGSVHSAEQARWSQDAEQGKLKLAVSASYDTQAHVFMVDVQPNGNIDIPHDHPAAQFFAAREGGFEFNGAYAEVVQVRGESGDTTHIAPLATVVGDSSVHELKHSVTSTTREYVPRYKLTPSAIENMSTTSGRTVEGFGGPAIALRKPLEKIVKRGPKGWYDRYGYETGKNRLSAPKSPRLEANPSGELKLGEELEWFTGELEKREGKEYVDKIREAINSSSELKNISPEVKTVTTIPVAAASESENIFNSLSLYAQQDEEHIKNNVILLNVNWLDTAKQDDVKKANIQKTFDEIERARREFPQLTIATTTNEYSDAESKKTGGVIGYVASDLMNTALMTLAEKVKTGELSSSADIAIIRQDADMKGMSRHFLSQLEKYMDRNKNIDIFNGVIRDDVRMHERYPGFGIASSFSRALHLANVAANRPWTVGINIVARASSLAAVGGLGKMDWTGPASDDIEVGQRISAARNGAAAFARYGSRVVANSVAEHKVIVNVPGMSVDSAGDRLIQQYLQGRPTGAAWDSDASGQTSFTDGPGGYRDRTEGSDIMSRISHEDDNDPEIYRRIEVNISRELSNSDERAAKRTLSLFFADAPHAYTINGAWDSGEVEFRLTKAGRRFIRKRITSEVNGLRGPGSRYGQRKMRQIYGKVVEGGRQPATTAAPFVGPIE